MMIKERSNQFVEDGVGGCRVQRCERESMGEFINLTARKRQSFVNTVSPTPHSSYCDVEEHDRLTEAFVDHIWCMYVNSALPEDI